MPLAQSTSSAPPPPYAHKPMGDQVLTYSCSFITTYLASSMCESIQSLIQFPKVTFKIQSLHEHNTKAHSPIMI